MFFLYPHDHGRQISQILHPCHLIFNIISNVTRGKMALLRPPGLVECRFIKLFGNQHKLSEFLLSDFDFHSFLNSVFYTSLSLWSMPMFTITVAINGRIKISILCPFHIIQNDFLPHLLNSFLLRIIQWNLEASYLSYWLIVGLELTCQCSMTLSSLY